MGAVDSDWRALHHARELLDLRRYANASGEYDELATWLREQRRH